MNTIEILTGIKNWVLGKINLITGKIPAEATSSNQLADKAWVTSRGFITKTVNDLVNYYTKSETYTKAEVQQIVDAIKQFTYEVVQVLPTASASTMNKIYLVPAPKSEDKNVKEEYITIQDGSTYSWEMLGTTSIDLSNYYTKGQTDSAISSALSSALASYTTTADLTTLLAQKQDVIQDLADIRSGASAGSTAVQPSTLNNAVKNVVAESGVYDVSANNDNTKFESLNALLSSANLNTLIPTDIRKGGMSIKFVLSSDNNYVQFRYMSSSTAVADFTNVGNWQGVDEEPIALSNNLVKSGGVSKMLARNYFVGNNKTVTHCRMCGFIPNRTYRVRLQSKTWNLPDGLLDNQIIFEIWLGHKEAASTNAVSIVYSQRNTIQSYYQLMCPADSNGIIAVTGRAIAGEKVWFEIEDVTNEITSAFSLSFEGANNNYISRRLFLTKGRSYAIEIDNPVWTTVGYEGTYKFRLAKTINGTTTYISENLGIETLNKQHFIMDNDADSLLVQVKADVGQTISMHVYDITEQLELGSSGYCYDVNLIGTGYCIKRIRLHKNSTYTIKFNNMDEWGVTSIPANGTIFMLKSALNGVFTDVLTLKKGNSIDSYSFQATDNSFYQLSIRGDVGSTIGISIIEEAVFADNTKVGDYGIANAIDYNNSLVTNNSVIDWTIDNETKRLTKHLCTTYWNSTMRVDGGEIKANNMDNPAHSIFWYYPVSKCDIFALEITGASNKTMPLTIAYSSTIPTIGNSVTILYTKTLASNELFSKKFEMTNDGWLIVQGNATMQSKIALYAYYDCSYEDYYYPEDITYNNDTANAGVDVVPDSPTFGELVTAGSANWKTTGYINISEYKYLKLNCGFQVSLPSQSVGAVFYDENKIPISGIPTFTTVSSGQTVPGKAWFEVPNTAVYARFTHWTTHTGIIALRHNITEIEEFKEEIERKQKILTFTTSVVPCNYSINLYWSCPSADVGTGRSTQGGVIYGDYFLSSQAVADATAIVTENKNPAIRIFNLRTKTAIQNDVFLSGFAIENTHCDDISFSTQKYDDGDVFPLLYVSSGYALQGVGGQVYVYRLVGELGSMEAQLVQTITLKGFTSWTDALCDDEGRIWLETVDSNKDVRYRAYNIPSLTNASVDIDITDTPVDEILLPEQIFPAGVTSYMNQGSFYNKGRIWVPNGNPVSNEYGVCIIVINVRSKCREAVIWLKDATFVGTTLREPETGFIWDNHLYINTQGDIIQRIDKIDLV